jgi:hypothetical protein
MGRHDRPDRTEPALANEPAESTEATEPAEPTDKIDPADPGQAEATRQQRSGSPMTIDRCWQPRHRLAAGEVLDDSGTGRRRLPAHAPVALHFSMTSAGTGPRSFMSCP